MSETSKEDKKSEWNEEIKEGKEDCCGIKSKVNTRSLLCPFQIYFLVALSFMKQPSQENKTEQLLSMSKPIDKRLRDKEGTWRASCKNIEERL